MVLPPLLLDRYRQLGHLYNQTSSTIEQLALADFIATGALRRHVKRLRRLYSNKNTLDVYKRQLLAVTADANFNAGRNFSCGKSDYVIAETGAFTGGNSEGGKGHKDAVGADDLPVSYTHLDVYKRQVLPQTIYQICGTQYA